MLKKLLKLMRSGGGKETLDRDPSTPERVAIPVYDVLTPEPPIDERDSFDLHRFLSGTRAGRRLRYELEMRIQDRRRTINDDIRRHDRDIGYAEGLQDVLDFATLHRKPAATNEEENHHG